MSLSMRSLYNVGLRQRFGAGVLTSLLLGGSLAATPAHADGGRCEAIFNSWTSKIETLASEFDIPTGSLKERLLISTYKGEMIRQTDARLEALGLVHPKGGICGPTCITNFMIAVRQDLKGEFASYLTSPPDAVHELVRAVDQATGRNARLYTLTGDLRIAIDRMKASEKLSDHFTMRVEDRRRPTETSLSTTGDIVLFVKVETPLRRAGHALMILGINRETRHVLILDPNFPDRPLVVSYMIGELPQFKDKVMLKLPAYTRHGEVRNEHHWSSIELSHEIEWTGLKAFTQEMHERYRR